jgi:hypothetical protein
MLPINFEKTETGGKCLPGCHQQFGHDSGKPMKNRYIGYDRDKPVKNR